MHPPSTQHCGVWVLAVVLAISVAVVATVQETAEGADAESLVQTDSETGGVIPGSYVVGLKQGATQADIEQLNNAVAMLYARSNYGNGRLGALSIDLDINPLQSVSPTNDAFTFTLPVADPQTFGVSALLYDDASYDTESTESTEDPVLAFLRNELSEAAFVFDNDRTATLSSRPIPCRKVSSSLTESVLPATTRKLQQQRDASGCPVVSGYDFYPGIAPAGNGVTQATSFVGNPWQLGNLCTSTRQGCVGFTTDGWLRSYIPADTNTWQQFSDSVSGACAGTYIWRPTPAQSANALGSWTSEGVVYEVFSEAMSYSRARVACKKQGSGNDPDLVVVQNQSQWDVIAERIAALFPYGTSRSESIWVGATQSNGNWINVDGTPLGYQQWTQGSPQLSQGCATFTVSATGAVALASTSCTAKYQFICQGNLPYQDPPAPVPSPVPVLDQETVPNGIRRIGAVYFDEKGVIVTRGAAGKAIAVVDTGVDLAHPDLNVGEGYNCLNPNAPPADDNGHGTHVSGTMSAGNNGFGIIGVAPGTLIIPVKVLNATGGGSVSQVICGLNWVRQNAARLNIGVVSMSLGVPVSPGTVINQSCDDDQKDVLHLAICRLVRETNVVVVSAAGNAQTSIDRQRPSGYSQVLAVTAMVDGDGLPYARATGISVPPCSTTDLDEYPAFYSNWATITNASDKARVVAAPGTCVYSTYPTFMKSYGILSGTSMATPHVAATIALCQSVGNAPCATLNYQGVIDLIVGNANRAGIASAQACANGTVQCGRMLSDGFLGDPQNPANLPRVGLPLAQRYYGYIVRAEQTPL